MLVFQCDRCGDISPAEGTGPGDGPLPRCGTLPGGWKVKLGRDLCPACIEDLDVFFAVGGRAPKKAPKAPKAAS